MLPFILGLLILSTPAFAVNTVPLSEAQRYISGCPGGVVALYTCADKPEEECLDFSQIEWCTAEIKEIKISVDDLTKPKYGSEKEIEACDSRETCQPLLDKKVCDAKSLAFISVDFKRVYCVEFKGFEQKEVITYELKESADKVAAKLAKEAADKAAKDAKDAADAKVISDLNATDWSKVKSYSDLIPIMKLLIKKK